MGIDLLLLNEQTISLSLDFQKELENRTFKEFLIDNSDYSISLFKKDFKLTIYYNGFILYKKYSRKDVFRILNWDKNPNPQTVGGYMVGKKQMTVQYLLLTIKVRISTVSIKYEDRFITPFYFNGSQNLIEP
ncbi:MAG: DUF3427 domain-containing protein [Chitinophagaceae bacterium]|nr:DUF3427 domain-containing protein [Chitinophagaceae bacterium]